MAFIEGFDVHTVDGLEVQPLMRCEACKYLFDDPTERVEAWDKHWKAEHGDPPARLNLIFRDVDGNTYRAQQPGGRGR